MTRGRPAKVRGETGGNLVSAEDNETPEEMAAFFDARAAGYDDHMRHEVFPGPTFEQFYQAVCSPIA